MRVHFSGGTSWLLFSSTSGSAREMPFRNASSVCGDCSLESIGGSVFQSVLLVCISAVIPSVVLSAGGLQPALMVAATSVIPQSVYKLSMIT